MNWQILTFFGIFPSNASVFMQPFSNFKMRLAEVWRHLVEFPGSENNNVNIDTCADYDTFSFRADEMYVFSKSRSLILSKGLDRNDGLIHIHTDLSEYHYLYRVHRYIFCDTVSLKLVTKWSFVGFASLLLHIDSYL